MKISEILKNYDENIDSDYIDNQFSAFEERQKDYQQNEDYYNGKHKILEETPISNTAKDNKVIANFAQYITTIANSHFIGKEPTYSVIIAEEETENDRAIAKREELEQHIHEWYKRRYVGHHDFTLGKYASIYGSSFELLYYDDASTEDAHKRIKTKAIKPTEAFLIRDTTIEEKVIGGVYAFKDFEDAYVVHLFTEDKGYIYKGDNLDDDMEFIDEYAHDLGDIPLIEYRNNEEGRGDFEQVIPLIDAYNKMLSTRVNDKEQFVDSIMVATGFDISEEDVKNLKENRFINLPDAESNIKYLTQTLDETHSDILQKNLKADIHRHSFVPDLSDDQFSGNSSGVALAYKLIGLEMLIKEKERNFEKGLRLRLKRILFVLGLTGTDLDVEDVNITFNRNLPTNIQETAEVIRLLDGIISRETLWGMLPDVKSVEMERKQWLADRREDLELEEESVSHTNADMFMEEDADLELDESPFTIEDEE